MKKGKRIYLAGLVVWLVLAISTLAFATSYPPTQIVDVEEEIYGVKVADPYRWLEKDTEEVRQWVIRQNKYTESVLSQLSAQDKIRKRLDQLYRAGIVRPPFVRGNRYFFRERKGDQEHGILYVQDGLKGVPRILIDPSKLSQDKKVILRSYNPSPDGKLLLYGLSESGSDAGSLHILEVDTGKCLPDVIPGKVYPIAYYARWTEGNNGFWYMRTKVDKPIGEERYHYKIYYHKLGTDWEKDPMVFGEDVAKEDISLMHISKEWILFNVWRLAQAERRSDLYLRERNNSEAELIPVAIAEKDVQFHGIIYKDKIYIKTNHQAPLYKIMAVDVKDVERGMSIWQTIIPESKHKLEEFYLIADKLIVETLENVVSKLRVYTLEGKFLSEIELPVSGSIGHISLDKYQRENIDEFFFGFGSFFHPYTIYRYDMSLRDYEIFKKSHVEVDSDLFELKQVWYKSKDFTKIPMFVMYKKGLKLDSNNPTMLYAYGGFGVSITPSFDKDAIMFLENGGVYAIANIRGGGEFGEEWYKAGVCEKKQNAFDDFIAAAEWLIDNKYTNSDNLAIFGWSNGGLLTGTVLIQRPDLFKAVIIGAPILDMLRYHKFEGGRYWMCDYGNPDNPEDFERLHAYSPYHNIEAEEDYPATMILIGDKDDRVHPLHSYKMTARLQAADKTPETPILLRVECEAGHGGATGISAVLELYTDMWSFVFWQLGIKE